MSDLSTIPVPSGAPVPGASFGPAASAIPDGARARLTDRLRAKSKPLEVLVDLGDGDLVLVRGMDVAATDRMNKAIKAQEEEFGEDDSLVSRNPIMLRTTCFDPETREPVFAEWSDAELNALSMSTVNKLMQGVNMVMGLDGTPGKDSPSNPVDAGSSS